MNTLLRIIISSLVISFSSKSFCQKEFKNKYKEFIEDGEKLIFSTYQKIGLKTKDDEFVMLTFFPETKQLTSEITFKDKHYFVKDGYATYWYDNGNIYKEGNFKNDLKDGHWKEYGNKGKLSSEGKYILNKRTGIWKEYYKNDTLPDIYNYMDGKRDGNFLIYDSLGILINQGLYSNDTLLSQTRIDTLNQQKPFFGDCNYRNNPNYNSSDKLLEYLYKNIRYPKDARELGVEGQALLRFVINKDGSISKVEALIGVCKSIKESTIKLLENMPDWCPGYSNNKAVNVTFTLPVMYKLE